MPRVHVAAAALAALHMVAGPLVAEARLANGTTEKSKQLLGSIRHWFRSDKGDHVSYFTFNSSVPYSLSSAKMWDARCDFRPSSIARGEFKLHNREELNREGIAVDWPFSWTAVLQFVFSAGTLLLSYVLLPENALGDLGNWHVFSDEEGAQRDKKEMFERMKKIGISKDEFDRALKEYKAGLDWMDEQQRSDLFEFLAGDEDAHELRFDKFSGVRLVPAIFHWNREWLNGEDEHFSDSFVVSRGDDTKEIYPLSTLLGSFRAFADSGERAWFALQLAAGNYEKMAAGSGLAFAGVSSRSHRAPDDFALCPQISSGGFCTRTRGSSVKQICREEEGSEDSDGDSAPGEYWWMSRRRIDADWGFEADPAVEGFRRPTLQDFILQRFDTTQPLHARMRAVELLAPCDLPGYCIKAEWTDEDKHRAHSYVTAMMTGACRLAGSSSWYWPWSIQTGLLIFIGQALLGTFCEVKTFTSLAGWFTRMSPASQSSWLPRPIRWWSYFFKSPEFFWLTFKPEVFLLIFYPHFRLLLITVRVLAMSGFNILTIRHSYARNLMSVLRCRKSVWISLAPSIFSIILFLYTLPFAPIVIMFITTWLLLVRPMERHCSHGCVSIFKMPMFTSAPPLALLLICFPCRLLTGRFLPDTYLCNWSRFTFLDPDDVQEAGSFFYKVAESDSQLAENFIDGLLVMCLVLAIGVPIFRCIMRTRLIQWCLMRLVYRGWLNQSECLLALLHEGDVGKTAKTMSYAFVKYMPQPILPQWMPSSMRDGIRSVTSKLDAVLYWDECTPRKHRSAARGAAAPIDSSDEEEEEDDDDEDGDEDVGCFADPVGSPSSSHISFMAHARSSSRHRSFSAVGAGSSF